MTHRISSGALVLRGDHILLVHHRHEGAHDFWVAPGGGVEGNETLEACAMRETREETGITIGVDRLAYIDELWSPTNRTVKFWFLAHYLSGEINTGSNPAPGEFIVEARWFALTSLPPGFVFPEVLGSRLATDLAVPTTHAIRLPLRELRF